MNNHIGDANKMVAAAAVYEVSYVSPMNFGGFCAQIITPTKIEPGTKLYAAPLVATVKNDPSDPWRGLYAPELMPKLDGAGDYHAAHPDLPDWPAEEERSIAPLIFAQGFTFHVICDEYPDEGDAPGEEFDTCAWLANWKPEPPAGEHWRLVMVHDTEDGPAAVYVRPLALNDASPKSGSADVRDAARYRWLRDEAISFPYDVEIASPWCVFGMNNAGTEIYPIDGAKLDAAIDAARQFAEDNQPQPTSHGARVPR